MEVSLKWPVMPKAFLFTEQSEPWVRSYYISQSNITWYCIQYYNNYRTYITNWINMVNKTLYATQHDDDKFGHQVKLWTYKGPLGWAVGYLGEKWDSAIRGPTAHVLWLHLFVCSVILWGVCDLRGKPKWTEKWRPMKHEWMYLLIVNGCLKRKVSRDHSSELKNENITIQWYHICATPTRKLQQ